MPTLSSSRIFFLSTFFPFPQGWTLWNSLAFLFILPPLFLLLILASPFSPFFTSPFSPPFSRLPSPNVILLLPFTSPPVPRFSAVVHSCCSWWKWWWFSVQDASSFSRISMCWFSFSHLEMLFYYLCRIQDCRWQVWCQCLFFFFLVIRLLFGRLGLLVSLGKLERFSVCHWSSEPFLGYFLYVFFHQNCSNESLFNSPTKIFAQGNFHLFYIQLLLFHLLVSPLGLPSLCFCSVLGLPGH